MPIFLAVRAGHTASTLVRRSVWREPDHLLPRAQAERTRAFPSSAGSRRPIEAAPPKRHKTVDPAYAIMRLRSVSRAAGDADLLRLAAQGPVVYRVVSSHSPGWSWIFCSSSAKVSLSRRRALYCSGIRLSLISAVGVPGPSGSLAPPAFS